MRRWYGGAEGVLAFTRTVMRCGDCGVLYISHNDGELVNHGFLTILATSLAIIRGR